MAEFAKRLGLDLPDALPRHVEEPTDLLQRSATAVAQAIAVVENLALAATANALKSDPSPSGPLDRF